MTIKLPSMNEPPMDGAVTANYIHWRLVVALGPETSQSMRDLHDELRSAVLEQPAAPRADACLSKVEDVWQMALTYAYLEANSIGAQVKRRTEDLVERVRAAFDASLAEAEWIDDASKTVVRDKLRTMTSVVAFPDWATNRTALHNFYQPVIQKNGLLSTAGGQNPTLKFDLSCRSRTGTTWLT